MAQGLLFGVSLQKPGFDPVLGHVIFVVYRSAPECVPVSFRGKGGRGVVLTTHPI
jgi:hypothetical protein